MKLLVLVSIAALTQGCAGTEEEVWSLELAKAVGDRCAVDGVTVHVTNHGDGDFTDSVVKEWGEMHVANTQDGYTLTIEDYDHRMLEASVHRTPQPGSWPDILEGRATISGYGCNGTFSFKGKAMSEEEYRRGDQFYTTTCIEGHDCGLSWDWD